MIKAPANRPPEESGHKSELHPFSSTAVPRPKVRPVTQEIPVELDSGRPGLALGSLIPAYVHGSHAAPERRAAPPWGVHVTRSVQEHCPTAHHGTGADRRPNP